MGNTIDTGQTILTANKTGINLLKACNRIKPIKRTPQVPLPCQVEAQENQSNKIIKGKCAIRFKLPTNEGHSHHGKLPNKYANRKAKRRQEAYSKATQHIDAVDEKVEKTLANIKNNMEQWSSEVIANVDDKTDILQSIVSSIKSGKRGNIPYRCLQCESH